ncbi:phosphate/phosphite/phosphonate ABC transporter substrate-binding protein [Nostoc sp.]|uniref:phosphate/phosphite/phosphonate ABC transporter substrate-binding protein n=1 Tax=Nostoc sp. TaxID=1180 RepID=UPI002FF91BF1
MSYKLSRRVYILQMLLLFAACEEKKTPTQELELVIGAISYEEGRQTLERFTRFREYLGNKTGAIIQLEPTFNENKALERVKHQAWSLVFAPPGLAALAQANYQYEPIFPLEIDVNSYFVFIVSKDSPLQQLKDLQGKTVALGMRGSATGYYFPLYNLYGLTLAEILFAPTPTTVFEWVAQGKASAGAVSLKEFNLYRNKLDGVEFRILFTDPQNVPPGAVLIAPNIDSNSQQLIRNYMTDAPPSVIQEVGYVPNGKIPDYRYMISVVKRVTSIVSRLDASPVRLF